MVEETKLTNTVHIECVRYRYYKSCLMLKNNRSIDAVLLKTVLSLRFLPENTNEYCAGARILMTMRRHDDYHNGDNKNVRPRPTKTVKISVNYFINDGVDQCLNYVH